MKSKRKMFSHSTFIKLKKIKACQICKAKDVLLTTHHIIPISKGGTNNISNLKRVCTVCHNQLHEDDECE